MRSQVASGLIVLLVVALVAGVAYFRSAGSPTEAVTPGEPVAVPVASSTPAQRGELCPEGLPSTLTPTAVASAPADQALPPTGVTAATPGVAPGAAPPMPDAEAPTVPATVAPPAAPVKLPRVVDLGADKCKACKDLAPILEQLRKEYAGRVTVDFIDVWKNPKAGEPYKIRTIPTQIFFAADGTEVWRHEGFLPKEEFIRKFAELGVK
ncbi:MAG TPA: thioredoxin domain-containing protein [Phycisphaerae bacterium]|nr:thioredoxin domain-containing protein [Phycisphaerae bacterium]HNU43718.1 thioredoxin domain-containing protein [Phycisphaerae bacterium]